MDQRQRQRRARQARLEAERLAHRSRRRRLAVVGAVIALAVATATVATFAGSDGDDGGGRAEAGDRPANGTTGDEEGEGGGSARCPPTDRPAERPRSFAGPFPRCIEDGVDYGAVLTTSKGAFTIDLAESAAPETVNNFVALSRYGWFDGDDFHRVVAGFVIQAGDPFGDPPGTGGPGYTIDDELPDGVEAYVEGAVAMANSGEPRTGGSQFFVCVDCSSLPGPNYSLFGQVTAGIEVVKAINALANGDGPPTEPVAIESVEITEA